MNIEPYSGDPLQWSDWRSRFDFMIGNTPLSNSQKIAYLQGLVTGKAKDVILHFHCNGQFYHDALRELERKFGKATTIVNAYIQQLLDHQPPIKGNPESYINYTIFIKGMIRNLQHLEHTADLDQQQTCDMPSRNYPPQILYDGNNTSSIAVSTDQI